ncbi:PrGVORF7 [Pieris rapae granulovirus Wuhan]|uniref:PrGVORF7 n=1 Tax=Pieris rapae granulovirus Wuhan TaxID=2848030 RepID=D2J4H4_9BBAC|nr:PrGVORF7 [Betabaculovirus arrapae]ACZ63493.1 PrGVORF7 [Betabaculovirus arrapae]ADO85432.1 unknown [Pieris rapae granulovirus]UOS85681.1 ORF7 [Pieris rapae granulovirus]
MFQIGRANSNDEVNIVFQMSNTLNSVTQFAYKFIDTPRMTRTKLVSGLDANRQINCVFGGYNPISTDNFVMSMFRLPYLIPDILNHTKINIVKVVTTKHQEFWYVIGVKRGNELPAAVPLKKIIVHEQEYEKINCAISGFIPADLMRALNYKIKNKNYLHSLLVTAPTSDVNNGAIRLIKNTNSTT